MRSSRMHWTHRLVLVGLFTSLFVGLLVLRAPQLVDDPAAGLEDRANEDLTRIDYPSLRTIATRPRFIRPQDSLESLYGKDWVTVARLNRVDRRHVYPGMTIREPLDMAAIRDYTPLPKQHAPAKPHAKYLLLDLSEQWIGAYERGVLKFSMPAATGKAGTDTPNGTFRIDARHRDHTSSLYRISEEGEQYPMDNALRFYIDEKSVGYWIHARDLPGRPASHGCIGLYCEDMQERVYGSPQKPVLNDAQRLYAWAAPDCEHGEDDGSLQELDYGPQLEVRGSLPKQLPPQNYPAR